MEQTVKDKTETTDMKFLRTVKECTRIYKNKEISKELHTDVVNKNS
jgi:hypothetical protein